VRRSLAAAAAALATLACGSPARAETVSVTMGFASFSPPRVDLLAGDTVSWRNASFRRHNIRSESAGFDSGDRGPGFGFAHTFTSPGIYPYLCTIHVGMTGEVAAHPLLLSGPRAAVVRGAPLALHVRGPEGVTEATIEEDSGGDFVPVAIATPPAGPGHESHDEPGTLHATVRPAASASYRAVSAAGASPALRVEVTDELNLTLKATPRRGGALLRVSSVPAQPRAQVALQLRLRERFGWWTVASGRLDRRSRARFELRRRRPVRARVVLLGADGVTALAASPPVLVRPRRR
jgi:plastocyanin